MQKGSQTFICLSLLIRELRECCVSLWVADSPQSCPYSIQWRGKSFHSQLTVQVSGRLHDTPGSLSAEMGIQCRQCHIPWQMQQCGEKRERVTHFYPALVLRNQSRQQLPRLHHKDAKAELQVLTMVADESLHQKPGKILLLRHVCQMTVSLEWVRRNL